MSGIVHGASQGSKTKTSIDLDGDDEDEYDPAPTSTVFGDIMHTRSGRTSSVRITQSSSEFPSPRNRDNDQREMNRLLGEDQRKEVGATPIPIPMSRPAPRDSKFGAFKPRDTLSTPLPLFTSAGSNVRRPKPQDPIQVDGPERKKRRIIRTTTIDMTKDDDELDPRTPGTRASRTSKVSSSTSNTVDQHASQRSRSNGVPEYRGVEHTVSVKNVRRTSNSTPADGDGFENSPSEYQENETVLNGTTIAQVKKNRSQSASKTQTTMSPYFPGRNEITSPRLSAQFVSVDGKRRNSAITPSDDELQGSPTHGNSSLQPAINVEDSEMLDCVQVVIPRSHIPRTHFTSNSLSPADPPKKRAKQGVIHEYPIQQIWWQEFEIPPDRKGTMVVNVSEKVFQCYLVGSQLGPESLCDCPTDKIQSIDHGHDPSGKACLKLSATSNKNDPLDVDFSTHKVMMDFIRDLQTLIPDVRVRSKESHWMDSAFARRRAAPLSTRSTQTDKSLSNLRKYSYDKASKEDTLRRPEANEGRTRSKLKDRLRDEGGLPVQRQSPETRSGTRKSTMITSADRAGAMDELGISGIDREILRLKPKEDVAYGPPVRTTRSATRKEDSLDSFLTYIHPKINVGPPWTKPLVFPKEGKKKTEVEFKDLDRLHEHEFLNDNLIAFYIRYLEYYLEQEQAELSSKIYIFNSFFYERLTADAKGKKGGINYAAVQKWTSKVDLFGYDFVVVPINESAHWYLAIICNLRNLDRKAASPDGQDPADMKSDDEIADAAIQVADAKKSDAPRADGKIPVSLDKNGDESNEDARDSFASLSLDHDGLAPSSPLKHEAKMTGPNQDEQDWPSEGENPKGSLSPSRKQTPAQDVETKADLIEIQSFKSSPAKKGRKPKRKSVGRKFSPETPAIITLDSLISSRSTTVKILKEYLREEAKAKRFMEIEDNDLQGVNAKGIPQQNNFSDCGLYLLAYLEAFLNNPKEFMRMIMQREMHEASEWPRFNGYDLRLRLLKIIQRLHAEQQDKKTPDFEEDKINRGNRNEGYTLVPPFKEESPPPKEKVDLSSEDEKTLLPKKDQTLMQSSELPKKPIDFKARLENKRRPRKSELSNMEGDSIDPLASESSVMKTTHKPDHRLQEDGHDDQFMAGLRDAAKVATSPADQLEVPTTPPPISPRKRGKRSVDTEYVKSPDRSYREALEREEASLAYETDGKHEDDVQMVEHPEQERDTYAGDVELVHQVHGFSTDVPHAVIPNEWTCGSL